MHIDIIIPTYNHLEDCLRPCLQSIIKNTTLNGADRLVRVIVSSNGSTDGTQDYVRSLGPSFVLLDHPEPLGYTKAANAGLRRSLADGADFVVLLNNDTAILDWGKDTWLNTLHQGFNHPRGHLVGLTGPHKIHSNDTHVDFLIFYCVMISRACLEAVGFLDEAFSPGGGEDTAFCFEAERKGFKIVQVPDGEPLIYSGVGNTMDSHFPIWHAGERTVFEIPNWGEVIKKNDIILRTRYRKERCHMTHIDIIIPTYNHL